MEFTVYLRINKHTVKAITLATSDEETGKPTVRDLKKKALSYFPGVDDLKELRLLYNGRDLEEDEKLEDCGIQQLDVIIAIMKMSGGGGPLPPPPPPPPKSESMERLNFM